MSTTAAFSRVEWVKSSYSNGGNNNCVEWAPATARTGVIPIRDSKRPERTPLLFAPGTWAAFVATLKS